MLRQALRRMHPDQACRCPALFLTGVAAALLSVLAVRDSIMNSSAVSFETLSAAALWGSLLLLACCLAVRDRAGGFPAWPYRQTAKHSPTPVPARVR
jgi:high-affinity K+ transport system ATPase subunit B